MLTEPQQYHNDDRTTTVSQRLQNHNSITMTGPQQYQNDNRTTTVSQ